jgi:hypothetical protein
MSNENAAYEAAVNEIRDLRVQKSAAIRKMNEYRRVITRYQGLSDPIIYVDRPIKKALGIYIKDVDSWPMH